MALIARFTCPFCMREYPKSSVEYVCPDCGAVAVPGRFAREPIRCSNPKCGGYATLRRCPYCQSIIPATALETPNLPFSIVGVSSSGKTNYITVMLNELARSSGLRLALGHQTNETLIHQRTNKELIYDLHTIPEATAAGASEPQIWYIRTLEKKHGSTVPTYTFTIFDGAGEDHEKRLDPTSTVCRYISASKAIILAVDPLVLPSVRRGGVVDPKDMANSLGGAVGSSKDAEEIVNSIATYIKTARGISAKKMLDIPVAVVLTKIDTVLGHRSFGPQALIQNPSLTVRNGKVDMAELDQIDEELRYWLESIGEGAFITTLASHFKRFHLFGVSSYGAPPLNATTLPDPIKPHRVLDPILWLFKLEKFID